MGNRQGTLPSGMTCGQSGMLVMIIRYAAVMVVLASSPLSAKVARNINDASLPADDRLIARCIQNAAAGRDWLEITLWGLRDQEAGWTGAQIRNSNGTYDLGPMQVNSWWIPKLAKLTLRPQAHVRWWLTHDPCFNVRAGKGIFLSALADAKDYWTAVGIYHSPTRWRRSAYARKVARHISFRFGADIFDRSASSSRGPNHLAIR